MIKFYAPIDSDRNWSVYFKSFAYSLPIHKVCYAIFYMEEIPPPWPCSHWEYWEIEKRLSQWVQQLHDYSHSPHIHSNKLINKKTPAPKIKCFNARTAQSNYLMFFLWSIFNLLICFSLKLIGSQTALRWRDQIEFSRDAFSSIFASISPSLYIFFNLNLFCRFNLP